MEKQTQVIDASIIVKWFSDEEFSNKAIEIKNRHMSGELQLIVPEILFAEVLNALRYKKNNEEKIIEVNKNLWEIGFKIERTSENLSRTIQ